MSAYLAYINIMPREDQPDPAGEKAIAQLPAHGVAGIVEARIGRHLNLKLYAKTMKEAHQIVEDACEKLLADPLTESWDFLVEAEE